MLAPQITGFVIVQAETLADAACAFLSDHLGQALFVRPINDSQTHGDTTYFARVDIRGEGEMTARYFYGGIGRYGGIRHIKHINPNERANLTDVERDLGLEQGDLTDCEWQGEESVAQAAERKKSRTMDDKE